MDPRPILIELIYFRKQNKTKTQQLSILPQLNCPQSFLQVLNVSKKHSSIYATFFALAPRGPVVSPGQARIPFFLDQSFLKWGAWASEAHEPHLRIVRYVNSQSSPGTPWGLEPSNLFKKPSGRFHALGSLRPAALVLLVSHAL